jgi:class 3 adenylate cyclase
MGRSSAGPDGLPEGILTFLLTDIEGSTPLWERHQAVMGAALARHEALVAKTVAAHGGRLIKSQGEGDSTLSVFQRASDAAAAAIDLGAPSGPRPGPAASRCRPGRRCTPARPSCAKATTSARP